MNILITFILIASIDIVQSIKTKHNNTNISKTDDKIKNKLEKHEEVLYGVTKHKSNVTPVQITDVVNAKIVPLTKTKKPPRMLPRDVVIDWAKKISEGLFRTETTVVHRETLLKSFSNVKMMERNGTAIVNKMAMALEELLNRRARAAEDIMRRAEELAETAPAPPVDFTFDYSVELDQIKKRTLEYELQREPYREPESCRSFKKVQLHDSKHFDAKVSLVASSVYVTAEVFICDPSVVRDLHWSQALLATFKKNYAMDSSLDFQYFCSAQGFLRHYPAALWESMDKLKLDAANVYDCRLRPWYVSAGGAPRDVLVLLDASGSMVNSSNQVIAEQFILALLSALTDDDRVNLLRFNTNIGVQSPISCFNEKLVSANHVNSAAMMAALKLYKGANETRIGDVLKYSVDLLQKQNRRAGRGRACQQAIVLLTDSIQDNYTDLLRKIDPDGRVRLFTLWLHDQFGLRDSTREYGEWLSCNHDGYFAELITHADVTQQVLKILQVLERPLVGQRKDRLKVFSDVYAHVEDPRRGEFYWRNKENAEQLLRYTELRKNKEKLLNDTNFSNYQLRQINYNDKGQYYEGEITKYRFQISVSVPVFDHRTSENITIELNEEKQRKSTRTYPVNRLLGVAGVDIPIEHLKLILPYHEMGAGGSLFVADHRGNIVLHDNIKPIFDGDILKPGYRTVDFLDLEQPGERTAPRHYPKQWMEIRNKLVVEQEEGNVTLYGKNIYEDGMRAIIGMRDYYWKRVLDHYTAVVVLPHFNRWRPVLDTAFTKELAEEALKTLSKTEFAVHPDWLYCQHVEPYFDNRQDEIRHFVRRRKDESKFAERKLKHTFSPLPPTLLEKTYQCDIDLMARVCKDAIATDEWARDHEDPTTGRDCGECELGSITAFYAGESGLTRWQPYHATIPHPAPPDGSWWPRGPEEPWYRLAVSRPGTLVVHAPVAAVSKMRNSNVQPPPFTIRSQWLTAARTLDHPKKGIIGVSGFHLHSRRLADFLTTVTNFPCTEDDEDNCDPQCDGVIWACVLIDENAWVVARDGRNETLTPEEPLRDHLATVHPAAMAALLDAQIFNINWVHDYQGVCFPFQDENSASQSMVPGILKTLWDAVTLVMRVTKEMVLLLTTITRGVGVFADTKKEKEKRNNRVRRDFEREKYDRLFDPRVVINRSRFAACDRSRALYELNTSNLSKLNRTAEPCSWPLVGAPVPGTNLLLLALYVPCAHNRTQLTDPLDNVSYLEPEDEVQGLVQSSASQLACWRHREPLPATRLPHTRCYPHNYSEEVGYRQCGPWLPDPETTDAA